MATTELEVTGVLSSTGWTGATVANLSTDNDVRATDGVAGEVISTDITDAPGDFTGQNSVTLHVSGRRQGTVVRDKTILVELLNSSDTVLESFTTAVLGASDAQYDSSALTRSDSQATIDGYRLRCTVQEGGGMPDSATVEIDHMWVTLEYSTASVFEEAITLAVQGDLTPAPGLVFEPASNFAATLAETLAPELAIPAALTISVQAGIASAEQLIKEGPRVSQDGLDTRVTSAGDRRITQDFAAAVVHEEAITLAVQGGESLAPELVMPVSANYGVQPGHSAGADLVFEPALTFAMQGTLPAVAALVFEPATSYAADVGLAHVPELVIPATVSYGFDATDTLAPELVIPVAASYGATLEGSDAADLAFGPAVTLTADLSLTPAAEAVFSPALSFAASLDAATNAELVIDRAISLAATFDVSQVGGLALNESLSWAASLDDNYDGALTITRALSLAANLTVTSAAALMFESAISFSTTVGGDDTAALTITRALSFPASLTATLARGLDINGAASYGATFTLTAADELIPGGPQTFEEAISFLITLNASLAGVIPKGAIPRNAGSPATPRAGGTVTAEGGSAGAATGRGPGTPAAAR